MNATSGRQTLPSGYDKVLLHSCCAPCSCEIIESLQASGIPFTIFFYNPNIHPQQEYAVRKEEIRRFAERYGVPFVDADYDSEQWFARAKGMEDEPERGSRCRMCFDLRLQRTALYAFEHGFRFIATSLGISRWKNLQQVNECGRRAAASFPGLAYWDHNWRKGGGSARMIEITRRENFYRQEYCGCVYSLRDARRSRSASGREDMRLATLADDGLTDTSE